MRKPWFRKVESPVQVSKSSKEQIWASNLGFQDSKVLTALVPCSEIILLQHCKDNSRGIYIQVQEEPTEKNSFGGTKEKQGILQRVDV